MKTQPARYQVYFGLAGCYMPYDHYGAIECHTRADLAHEIRNAIDVYDLPASLFRETKIRRLWQFIQRHGSSTAHFHLHHKGYCLTFSGLTEDEFTRACEEPDFL